MERPAVTAFPRQQPHDPVHAHSLSNPVPNHGRHHGHHNHQHQHSQPARTASTSDGLAHSYQYASDPTLLESGRVEEAGETGGDEEGVSPARSRGSGRRSAAGDYPNPEERQNFAREARKTKKKKLKHLRSFVHVFLGGLRKSSADDDDVIASTRDRQRDERNGLAGSAATDSHGPLGPKPAPLLSRLPNWPDIPGLKGLQNHGNTCFMNAILQCLSNTDRLAEFFVTDQYKDEVSRHRAVVRKYGNGAVTEEFALLLKCLWNGQYDARVTARFKDIVGRLAPQYQGNLQHDAQEFFLWLLDNVHEDLNQAGKKKYRPIKDTMGRSEEEIAFETLQSHMKSNNSFIQNLFQGQFRSALLCPTCGSQSCTFDPYICVSLPLPQRDTRPIYVTVVYRSTSRKSRVFGVNIPINASIRDLRNALAELCGVHRHHLVLCDVASNGFNQTFYDDQHIAVVNSHDLLFGFECPPYRGDNPEAQTTANPSGSKELVLILVVNKLGQTQYGKRFGPPLILRIWRDLTHSQFQSVVLKSMSKYIREGVQLTDVCRSGVLFRCRVIDGLPGRCILPSDVEHPFYFPSVDKAMSVSMLYGAPAHIKIVAEWEPETKASVFGIVPDEIPEPHESARELREYYCRPLEASLQDCLQIYTKEETLNREDSWFCPHCKHQQQDATKKITLWTLPDVLVLHLKRFRQVGFCRTKLNTLISFPITGLDMTPFLAPTSPLLATVNPPTQDTRHAPGPRSSTLPNSVSKSVRFNESSPASRKATVNRTRSSGGVGGKRFHFRWRKSSSKKGSKINQSKSPPDTPRSMSPSQAGSESPSSVRSAPSFVGHSIAHARGRSPSHAPLQSSHAPLHLQADNLETSSLDNVYDLYAVCNHMGSMTRGHYTACCRNPADGNWYLFDDNTVQPIPADKAVTAGAYMLFYVRQSIMAQSPLSSSDSSTSSSNSAANHVGGASANHWIYHIPQFRLDPRSFPDESASGPVGADEAKHRARLNSATSAVSAPPGTTVRGLTPPTPSSMVDNESEVFASVSQTSYGHPPPNLRQARQPNDARSAVSLPPYPYSPVVVGHPTSTLQHQTSPPPRAYPNPPRYEDALAAKLGSPTRGGPRHHSLRVPRTRQISPASVGSSASDDLAVKRGQSFQSPRHHPVQRSETLPGRQDFQPVFNQPVSAVPSRSNPNMIEADYGAGEPTYNLPTVSPTRQRSSSYSNSKVFAVQGHPESCV